MNNLLIFFALPIAVIVISIALQKILKCPWLVTAIVFAIFLIVTFVINNLEFLIATIVYTIISLITAFLTCIIGKFLGKIARQCLYECERENNSNLITISNNSDNGNNCGCNQNEDNVCSYQITNGDGLNARINIIPNVNNNTDTNGCGHRRR